MKAHQILLLAASCALSTCDRAVNNAGDDAEWREQQKRARKQADDFDRQTEHVDKLQTKSYEHNRKTDELLKSQEEQNRRFDDLLIKWEEQARRQDAILDAQEKQHGIKK